MNVPVSRFIGSEPSDYAERSETDHRQERMMVGFLTLRTPAWQNLQLATVMTG